MRDLTYFISTEGNLMKIWHVILGCQRNLSQKFQLASFCIYKVSDNAHLALHLRAKVFFMESHGSHWKNVHQNSTHHQ